MPEAGEVFLVWGINGWNVVPKEMRPAGTVVKDRVMHTPMDREDDTFVAQVQAPVGATLDYGFLITKNRRGTDIEPVWDGDHDYRITSAEDGTVEVKATLTLAQAKELPGVLDTGLYLLIAICVVFGIGIILIRTPGLAYQGPSIRPDDAVKDCLFLGIVVLFSLILYVGRLGFYSDDWSVLGYLNMSADQSLTGLYQTFYEFPHVKMRPVQTFYLAGLYWLFGLHPLGYHLVNAGVFLLSVIQFYLTLRELGQQRILTLAVPVVYALLPHYSTDRFWYVAFAANLSMALYFLSLYADLRALRAPLARLWGWKLLSILSLLGSTLAYEIVLPLFFFNLFLVWYLVKQHFGSVGKSLASRTWTASLGGNLLALIAVLAFKALTMTHRIGNQVGFLEQTVSIAKRAIAPHYSYGFNFKQAFVLSYGDYVLGLPRIIWRILNDYPNVAIFTLGGALGLIIIGYLYYIFSQSETRLSDSHGEMSRLVAWGVILFGLGYAIFLTNSELTLTTTGVGNRVNIAAAVGIALSLVGGLGWVSTILPSARLRKNFFCLLVTLLCVSGFLINNTLASFWITAYRQEQEIIADIQRQYPTLPTGSILFLDGVCPYVGPAIVFESHWDLAGALMMHYRDYTLRADIVAPNLKVREDGLYTTLYRETHYPYENLFVYHFGQKTTYQLTDAKSAHHYFQTFNPDYDNDCPQGQVGHGVPVF